MVETHGSYGYYSQTTGVIKWHQPKQVKKKRHLKDARREGHVPRWGSLRFAWWLGGITTMTHKCNTSGYRSNLNVISLTKTHIDGVYMQNDVCMIYNITEIKTNKCIIYILYSYTWLWLISIGFLNKGRGGNWKLEGFHRKLGELLLGGFQEITNRTHWTDP